MKHITHPLQQPLSLGLELIEGRYRPIKVLGRGGFGEVYQAEQLATGQLVAIKVLLPELLIGSKDPGAEVARFEREMQLIAQLKHPNIVRLIDSGQLKTGGVYAVLEFVEGESLAEALERRGGLSPQRAKRLMVQTLEALAHAHARGVIHRDLKPQNIMVSDAQGRANVRVLDFGIAGIAEPSRAADYRSLTATGQMFGTPAYMAPEQLSEQALSPRVDLYAWGLVFLEALTGRPAVSGGSFAEIIFKQMSAEEIELPDDIAGTALGRVIARAVQKDPALRYQTASEILDALDRLPPLPSAPFSHHATPARSNTRSRWTLGLILLGLIGGGVASWSVMRAPEPPLSVTLPSPARRAPCPSGQEISADTEGRCCWPGQAWNQQRCVGAPTRCPEGTYVDELTQRCTHNACDAGEVLARDREHCCWPGQAWSSGQERCVGWPDCSRFGMTLDADNKRCLLPNDTTPRSIHFDRFVELASDGITRIAQSPTLSPTTQRPTRKSPSHTVTAPIHEKAPEVVPPQKDPEVVPPQKDPEVVPPQKDPEVVPSAGLEQIPGEMRDGIKNLSITAPPQPGHAPSLHQYRSRARTLLDHKEPLAALLLLGRGLKEHEGDATLRRLYADALEAAGHPCEAIAQYRLLLEDPNEHAMTRRSMAKMNSLLRAHPCD